MKMSTKRKPRTKTNGKAHCFGIRTRLARAVGKESRYSCNTVRALPSNKQDEVILQATDGKQAVCLMSSGEMAGPRLVPSDILPTRQLPRDAVIKLVDGHWQSSEGKLAGDDYGEGRGAFPAIGEVLPAVSKRPHHLTAIQAEKFRQANIAPPHVVLGVDIDLLNKQAMALGTSRLTLLVPVPIRYNETAADIGTFVNKAVCVCPADGQDGVHGVGVVMPLTPERSIKYYEQIRQQVTEAEGRATGKSTPRPDRAKARGNGRTPAPAKT